MARTFLQLVPLVGSHPATSGARAARIEHLGTGLHHDFDVGPEPAELTGSVVKLGRPEPSRQHDFR
jgi:hypothetical protein